MGAAGHDKPAASLSSTLLARKGQARPAMRPQGLQDDLGWNDMGSDSGEAEAAPVPPVLVQRAALHDELTAPTEAEPASLSGVRTRVSVATAARIERETGARHGGSRPKSAFTLRLDADRHLRLRLASALHNASAQTLVTEALDRFLQSLPEVEDLVRRIPTRRAR